MPPSNHHYKEFLLSSKSIKTTIKVPIHMISFIILIICFLLLFLHYREPESKTTFTQVIIFFVIIISFVALISTGSTNEETKNYQKSFTIGQNCTISRVSLISNKEQNIIDYVAFAESENKEEIEKMKWGGELVLIEEGIQVKILSENNNIYKVMIQDGFYKNNIAYLDWSSLR